MSSALRDHEYLPQVEPTDSANPVGMTESSQRSPVRPRIIVVDDDACFCELLSLYFMAKGFEVVSARTAEQAQALIERGRFDLLILDWFLNGEDSLDLLNLSKKRHSTIPVIIFTGAEVDVLLKKELAGRVDGVVRKMGSLESLSSHVCHHLGWPELRLVK